MLSIVLKLAWPSLPFIDRVGLVFLLALALAVVRVAAHAQGAAAATSSAPTTSATPPATSFNVASLGVVAILVALYATFW